MGRQITRNAIDSNDFLVRKSNREFRHSDAALQKGFFRDRVVKAARNEIAVTRQRLDLELGGRPPCAVVMCIKVK